MNDDAYAPTLSLAELEEVFADLQAVLHDKDEAIAKVESLSLAEPGTEEYDDVFSEWDTDEQTRAVIQQLIVGWNVHIDELEEVIANLIDVLSDHGQGAKVKQFFEDQIRPIVEFAAEDDAEKTFYST
eukprot:34081-Prymnesium_polylepis.1